MEQEIRAMFAWTLEGEETAKQFGNQYSEAGIEVVFYGEAKEDELISLGKKENMTHVLYFLDPKRLLLVSLADEMGGFTVEVLVEELVIPG